MNRRIFLKLLGISPVVPSVLMAKPEGLTLAKMQKVRDWVDLNEMGCDEFQMALNEVVAQRMAYPAWIVHPDGSMERITNEQLFIDPTKEFCEAAARELPPLIMKAQDEAILSIF